MAPTAALDRLAAVRAAEFGQLEGIYLNAASYGPLPARSLRTMRAFEDRRAAGALQPPDFGDAVARARTACAALVGAEHTGIALVPNTSVGLNIAAAMTVQRAAAADAAARGRTAVIVPDREFPANVYPWLALERQGLRFERIATDERGCPDEDALIARLAQGDVATLAISAVQFATGYRADLERLGAACARYGTLFVVDAIQAAGIMPIDVRRARIDILACGGQKWLCGPFGTGFCFVRDELVQTHEPALPGWLAFQATADFTRLLDYSWQLWPDARRFEVGSLGIQGFLGLAESVELILEVGVENIAAHVLELHEPLLEWAASTGGAPIVPDATRRAGILSIFVRDVEAVHAMLEQNGVACVPREGAIRFAPHFYTTPAEIERVVELLRAFRSPAQ